MCFLPIHTNRNVQRLELLDEMKRRWPHWINPAVVSVKLLQSEKSVVLELMIQTSEVGFLSKLTNLRFITGDDLEESSFKPEADIVDNAMELVKMDAYSLLNCIEGFFREEAVEEIIKKHGATIN